VEGSRTHGVPVLSQLETVRAPEQRGKMDKQPTKKRRARREFGANTLVDPREKLQKFVKSVKRRKQENRSGVWGLQQQTNDEVKKSEQQEKGVFRENEPYLIGSKRQAPH